MGRGILVGAVIFIFSSRILGQNTTEFQQQLQRLQSAVNSARQTGIPAGSQPAFAASPQATTSASGITPPNLPQTPLAPPSQNNANMPALSSPTPNGQGASVGMVPSTTTPTALPGAVSNSGAMTGVNLRDQAFSETSDNLLPLTPDQIRTLHGLFSSTQRAVGEVAGVPPRPTSTSKIVNLDPGATPPLIRLAAGFVTSLVFLDATGSAWPVDSYDLGDPRSYNIQWDRKSNMLMVQAITEYKSGNLAVMLKGLSTPIMLTLLPGQRAVDYRVDLRIPGMGPQATPTIVPEALPGSSNPVLLDVLNGVPPPGSRTLKIQGRDCSVWLLSGKMYLRTRLTVLSPGWISTLTSADGMHAYEMQPTPVILASENGKMVKLTIQGL